MNDPCSDLDGGTGGPELNVSVSAVRRLTPPEFRVAYRRLNPQRWRGRRTVRSGYRLPSSLTDRPVVPGSVWGVTMMRNEVDVAEGVVRHMLDQGCEQLLVADNGSTDGTRDLLMELSSRVPLHVADDTTEAHLQGLKMTYLSEVARSAGADWVVPFDADELWFAPGQSLAEFLRGSQASIVHARLFNVFPSPDDDATQADPFRRLRMLDPTPASMGKVAVRTARWFHIADGNHDATRRGSRGSGISIVHFPWRSAEQMTAKLRNGRKALTLADLGPHISAHWLIAGQWSDDELAAAWSDLCRGQAVEELTWSPSGAELRPVDISSCGSWSCIEAQL